jgi:O-antigen ligase
MSRAIRAPRPAVGIHVHIGGLTPYNVILVLGAGVLFFVQLVWRTSNRITLYIVAAYAPKPIFTQSVSMVFKARASNMVPDWGRAGPVGDPAVRAAPGVGGDILEARAFSYTCASSCSPILLCPPFVIAIIVLYLILIYICICLLSFALLCAHLPAPHTSSFFPGRFTTDSPTLSHLFQHMNEIENKHATLHHTLQYA